MPAGRRPLLSEHSPGLAHHFDDLEQQHAAGSLGMWLFLVTEILFETVIWSSGHTAAKRPHKRRFSRPDLAIHEILCVLVSLW
jgi:hypothetical protein